MNEMVLKLSVDDADARARFDTAVDALLEEPGSAPQLIVSLGGDDLPADLVATMVGGLRRLREVGGAIAVDPQSAAIGDAMSLHGLDRVFALPIDPENATSARRVTWVTRLATACLLVLAFMVSAAPSKVAADTEAPASAPDAAAIVARVIERNPELSTYQGRLHVDIRLISFPFVREHLDATTYYKRPSNYEVVFDRVPGFAKGFEKLYTDIGDPAAWDKRFNIAFEGMAEFNHHRDYALRLVLKNRGMIDHETVLVDPAAWTIDQIRYDYYNGGSITMSQQFQTIGGYSLLVSQHAEIAIPHVHAIANGTYGDYQTNVALNNAVFERN